jgi:hypothetical protein
LRWFYFIYPLRLLGQKEKQNIAATKKKKS